MEEMPHMTQPLEGVTSLEDLPIVTIGCDSSASWARRYRHLSHHEEVATIAQHLVDAQDSKNGAWQRTPSGSDVHLVITGGEPLLGWQRAYPALLQAPLLHDLKNLTFETNGTQALRPDFFDFLSQRQADPRTPDFHLTWSVSPKLSRSGEAPEAAIRPEILLQYARVPNSFLYLKFVVGDAEDFVEAETVVTTYRDAGVPIDAIYAMPQGAMDTDYMAIRGDIADLCLAHGFRFSPRLHVDLFGNKFGT